MATAVSDSRRLSAVDRSLLLDTDREAPYDRITLLAARVLGAPVALLSIVTFERQFFKSSYGLGSPWSERRETPLSHSFCQHVVETGAPFVVNDARVHPLVRDNCAIADMSVVGYLGVPVRDGEGKILGSLCAITHEPRSWTANDLELLTEFGAVMESQLVLRKALRETDILAREYHHRVKNAMAVASSLVTLSGREATTVGEAVATARGRLTALAKTHDALVDGRSSVDLGRLVDQLMQPYALPGSIVNSDGPTLTFVNSQTTPICLLIHELATNSAKYGALLGNGRISITWTISDDDMVTLVWEEHAPSICAARNPGFGSQLVRIVADQLHGKLTVDWHDGWMRKVLVFPHVRPEASA